VKKKDITTDTVISQIEEIVASDIDGEAGMLGIFGTAAVPVL